jgi:SAM-dependent methyltransferase
MSREIKWKETNAIDVISKIEKELKKYLINNKSPILLDVGGVGKYWKAHSSLAKGYKIIALNIDKAREKDDICGDICSNTLKDNTFDVVFSRQTFEHIKEPWIAAEECVRITKLGGLVINLVPWSYRYHPSPIDFYRFSDEGIAYLYERTGKVERIFTGYDKVAIAKRNKKVRANKSFDLWHEEWIAMYIGRKT